MTAPSDSILKIEVRYFSASASLAHDVHSDLSALPLSYGRMEFYWSAHWDSDPSPRLIVAMSTLLLQAAD
jgi:hypothetical protein